MATKAQLTPCRDCDKPIGAAKLAEPPEAQVWTCIWCGTRNYVSNGAECDCPEKGYSKGPSCRVARRPGTHFTSDDWCPCPCHTSPPQVAENVDYDND